jgi:hypothetical protein
MNSFLDLLPLPAMKPAALSIRIIRPSEISSMQHKSLKLADALYPTL